MIKNLMEMSTDERSTYLYNLSREDYGRFLMMDGADKVDFSRIFTHVHCDDGSPKDSILTIDQYVERCKETGTKYVTITDHGSMYSVQTLYNKCAKAGITLIIGCEFYVCDDEDLTDNSLKHTRLHLCGYAKNKAGYRALCRLVTEGNDESRVIKSKKEQYPCISRKILMKYVGPGTEGHGNVIFTSACIGGVLTGISFEQETNRINIEKIMKKYSKNKTAYDLSVYSKQKICELEVKKSLASDQNSINAIKAQISEFKTNVTACNKLVKKFEKDGVYSFEDFGKYLDAQKAEIDKMKENLIPEEKMEEEMTEAAKWYDSCAGHGNFYIEIQYHELPAEQKYEHVLCNIAHKLNIPLIAGIDAHMKNKGDARARKYVNALRFDMYEPASKADEELYLKNDGDLYTWLKMAVKPEDAIEAITNCTDLYEQCSVKLEKEKHYPVYPISDQERLLIANIPDMF